MQASLNHRCARVRAAKDAPRDPCSVLERRHGLAEIVERGARRRLCSGAASPGLMISLVERLRVLKLELERDFTILTNNAFTVVSLVRRAPPSRLSSRDP